jgi:Tfp pilus assembly protein PilF
LSILADAHAQLQNHAESDSTYEALLSSDPRNYRALNNYSYNLALRSHRLDDALLMSEKTIKAHPKNPAYLDTYGFILYQLKRYEEAESYLLNAVEYSTLPNAGILENYADVLSKLGRQDEAIRYFRLAIDAGANAIEINSKIQLLKNNE